MSPSKVKQIILFCTHTHTRTHAHAHAHTHTQVENLLTNVFFTHML